MESCLGHVVGHRAGELLFDTGLGSEGGVDVHYLEHRHDTATQYAADALALRAHRDGHGVPLPVPPVWLDALHRLDPSRVALAHDHSVRVP